MIFDDAWENGDTAGWKYLVGSEVVLDKDPGNAFRGDYVFYESRQVAVFKTVQLDADATYELTVVAKSEHLDHPLQVSLMQGDGPESSTLFNRSIVEGIEVENGYRQLTGTFRQTASFKGKLLLQNHGAGWIGAVRLEKIE
ncbi:hypothetical protein [Streptomyces roseolus]|uniref:hypothetical protein n=1 Tax=Streptomyces roseolus TaxID=67358 RepID=UPI0037915FDA